METNIKFKKLNPNAVIPTQGSPEAAGYDLYACLEESVTVNPHEVVKIGTGLAITPPMIVSSFGAAPIKTFGAIFPRSGLATKRGLRLANGVGVADRDYTGEYIVPLYNDSNIPQTIEPNERIAQVIFIPYVASSWQEGMLEETDRGAGGFGSTGSK